MSSDNLHVLNELFLHRFPGIMDGEENTITFKESRFEKNKPSVLSPDFVYENFKEMWGYNDKLGNYRISDRLDKLLWDHYDVFKHINLSPLLKRNIDYTVIIPLIDLFDMAWNERNKSLTVRALTSKTELNIQCVGLIASGVMDIIDNQFKYWEVDMGKWWENTIDTRKRLKEMSNPKDGTDDDHLEGYFAHNLMEKIEWEEDTKLTDKSIFVYRILCVLDLTDNQNLLLLDEEPNNGILRKTLAEYIRNKIKSYKTWSNKRAKH